MQKIVVYEKSLIGKIFWYTVKGRALSHCGMSEPKAECQAKDEYIWGYLPTSDLLSMTDEQVFRALE